MRAFEHAEIVGRQIQKVGNGRTGRGYERLKARLLASKSGGVQIGQVVGHHFERLTLSSQPGACRIESAVHVGSLQLDRVQANRHDDDGNVFNNDFVLNRLGTTGGKERLEASKNRRTGKTLPGKKGRCQVSGHNKGCARFS